MTVVYEADLTEGRSVELAVEDGLVRMTFLGPGYVVCVELPPDYTVQVAEGLVFAAQCSGEVP